ncbi:MAG TPA: hypothetical protein VK918_08825 [Pyrinomonadaceae bacterium]|nr:hypothetical protein [Pyrinomonadaceae bacterium]
MIEADIFFERENREGVVPVGTYLIDAAKRLGIRPELPCDIAAKQHHCKITVTSGEGHLSHPTSVEKEYFEGDIADSRLGCQVKIDSAGEIRIMTESKTEAETKEKEEQDEKAREEEYIKNFASLPLEKKMASLVKLEAMAIGETLNYIANSPYVVFDKVLDVMASFGLKMHDEEKAATRPDEHKQAAANGNGAKKETSSAAETPAEEGAVDDTVIDAEIPAGPAEAK